MPRTISKEAFYLSQVLIGILFIAIAWIFLRPKRAESNFRVREEDRPKAPPGSSMSDELARSKMKRNEPLRLTGIRIDGLPHEILGVRADAPAAEVQRAYRDLMKRYHPDLVGRPGTREWTDAQRIAEAVNRAKDALLKGRK